MLPIPIDGCQSDRQTAASIYLETINSVVTCKKILTQIKVGVSSSIFIFFWVISVYP